MKKIKGIIKKNKFLFYGLLIILIFFSITSLFRAVFISYGNSSDIPWTTARLFWNHINPHEYFLNGNLDNFILWGQEPNKFHLFYILLTPLAFFEVSLINIFWCLLNIIFLTASLINMKKIFVLNNFDFFLIASIFLMSTPLRSSISEGQYSLFIFYFISMYWISDNSIVKSINLSLSTIKYSLAPSFFIYSFFKEKKILLNSFIILTMSVILFAIQTKSFSLEILFQPIQVAVKTHTPGLSDFSTVISYFTGINIFVSLSICIFFSIIIVYYLQKFPKNEIIFSILCLMNLFLLPHASYDYIFLLPSLCLFIKINKITIKDILYIFPVFFYFFYEKIDVEYVNFFYPNGSQTTDDELILFQSFGVSILFISIFALLKILKNKYKFINNKNI
jgi:hypothetical protein